MITVDFKKTPRNEGANSPTEVISMTPQQIQNDAAAVMQGLSALGWRSLDLLFAGGIMTVEQLQITERTLRRYAAKRVVDRYPFSPKFVTQRLGEYGIEAEKGYLYTLGPVGAKIAEMRHGFTPPSGYLAYPLERVLHDVVVNEIVLRIARQADAHGWETIWGSKYEGALSREDVPILEPDAFFHLKRENEECPFLIEYHNEDKRTRAIKKVRQYERAWESDLWQDAWEVEEFPPLLAVFRNSIVHEGYKDAVLESAPLSCQYYGRTLGGFLTEMDHWYHYNDDSKVQIFPWLREKR